MSRKCKNKGVQSAWQVAGIGTFALQFLQAENEKWIYLIELTSCPCVIIFMSGKIKIDT